MRLSDVVATAAKDTSQPAVALAMAYAERIDESGHTGLALAAALDELERAARLADESSTEDRVNDTAMRAWRKVAAALSAVTVAAELGPKLLAALDAALLTPKARAAIADKLPAAPATTGGLAGLRAEEDELGVRRAAKRAS